MKRVRIFPIIIYILILVLLFAWILGMFTDRSAEISYAQVQSQFQAENVSQFVIDGNNLTMTLHEAYKGKSKVTHELADPDGFVSAKVKSNATWPDCNRRRYPIW